MGFGLFIGKVGWVGIKLETEKPNEVEFFNLSNI